MSPATRQALGALVNAIALDESMSAEERRAMANAALELDEDDDQAGNASSSDNPNGRLDGFEELDNEQEAYRRRQHGRLTVADLMEGMRPRS